MKQVDLLQHNKMKPLLISLSLLFYTAMSSIAWACSCAYGGYWVSDFVKDKTVFEGRAISSTWIGDDTKRQFSDHSSETVFQISQPYWNAPTENVVIGHNTHGAACGLIFGMGQGSLVIAYKNNSSILHTDMCTGSAIDEITLINYFENDIDVYIPSVWDCDDEQIQNPKDAKNCYYWSMKAEQERSIEASKRRSAIWKSKREVKKALTLSNETP